MEESATVRIFSCGTHGAPDQQCTSSARCTVWECTMCGPYLLLRVDPAEAHEADPAQRSERHVLHAVAIVHAPHEVGLRHTDTSARSQLCADGRCTVWVVHCVHGPEEWCTEARKGPARRSEASEPEPPIPQLEPLSKERAFTWRSVPSASK